MKTKPEIFQFVKSHFEKNPRSEDETGCIYYNENTGSGCPFTICVKDEFRSSLKAFEGVSASTVIDRLGFENLLSRFSNPRQKLLG